MSTSKSLAIALTLSAVLAACSPTTTGSGGGGTSDQKFSAANIGQLLTDPSAHKGATIDIVGKVFGEVESDAIGVAWQMWGDPRKSEFNIAVTFRKPGFAIKSDDYAHVVGTVEGELKGKNAFGAEITAAKVIASSAEVVDALAAAPPAIKIVNLNANKDQHGLTIIVEKVEFAAEETRVFVTVTNGTKNKASFYDFNAKALQGSTQYEPESLFDGYPEVQSELLPGVKSSGVVVFPKVDTGQVLKVIFEARTDDYRTDFDPFEFEIPV